MVSDAEGELKLIIISFIVYGILAKNLWCMRNGHGAWGMEQREDFRFESSFWILDTRSSITIYLLLLTPETWILSLRIADLRKVHSYIQLIADG